jgi:insulysin
MKHIQQGSTKFLLTKIGSKADKSTYKYIQLKNEMRCILVSDPEADKSSITMSVEVGSVMDPREYQGLAHFWEHMLFLGTEKYPVENHYGKFISEHGGKKNAATSFEKTYYYFDISNEHLNTAADIFSQFFKWPLFNESAVEREINAVDSEFRKNYQLDSRKLYQLFKSHATNPLSHFSKFQTGNLDHLSKPEIRDALIKFHSNYYSSNLMNLCIYGRDPIDDLEKLVIENFEDVENRGVEFEDRSVPHPFPEDKLGKIFKVVPHKDIRKLDIKWVLPPTKQLYRVKPGEWISHVVGHEGPNSLLSYLIREGLAYELTSSNDHVLEAWDYFHVSIKLTQKGEQNYEQVMKIVFAAINYLKHSDLQKYIYDEMVAMNKISFENEPKQKAISISKKLAWRMNKLVKRGISMEELLYYPYILEEFDEDIIKSHIHEMSPHRSMVFLTTKSNSELANETEAIYNTKFNCSDIKGEFLEELDQITFEQIESEGGKTHSWVFGYPPKNDFIPYDSQILKSETPTEFKLISTPELKDCKVWFKMDDKFDLPKINAKVVLRTNDLDHSKCAKAKIFKHLWWDMIHENLREISYWAELAQIHYSIDSWAEGVSIVFHGFNDGIQNFIKDVIEMSVNSHEKLQK